MTEPREPTDQLGIGATDMTDNTQPEALRRADEITELMCSNEAAARRIAAAADELCRLHYENQRLAALVEAQQPATSAARPVTPQADSQPAMTPETVYAAIAHGDEEHRAWLLSALRAVWCGEAVPPVASPIANAAAESQPAPVEVADAMADSQYLAGVSAGWNAANADDPNAALQKLHESRAGYLKPLRAASAPAPSGHIKEPYTVAEIKAKIASNDYSAELLLQHAMLHLDRLAASAGSEPVAVDGWLHENGLLYRLTDERHPCNRDEINVTMADGSRSIESRSRRALELLDRIRAARSTPNFDSLAINLIRYCNANNIDTSASIFLSRFSKDPS